MAPALDVLYVLALLLTYLLLPLGLMVLLLVLSRRYRGMFDQIGFTRKEMGLLIVGSLSTLLVPSEVPLFAYGDYFLAVNLGGAIIPTVLSIHLLRAKKIPVAAWSLGVLAVSLITYLLTRVQPSQGIVAEFPWLFVPALTGALLALVLFGRDSPRAPAFAYAAATLGSLIGADAFHLPELFQSAKFVGSIGGAGVFDLVYVGGLVSFALVLIFVSSRMKEIRRKVPLRELARERIVHELRTAMSALIWGQYQIAAQRALGAVQTRLGAIARQRNIAGTYPEVLRGQLPDPNLWQVYDTMARYANMPLLDYASARWCLHEAQILLEKLQAAERRRYATVGHRVAAFAVDAVFLAAAIALLATFVFPAGRLSLRSEAATIAFALLFWAWTVQVLYFTLFEHLWSGRTPGKALLRIRVLDLAESRPDFITVFTRNVVRILDFLLLGYLVSLALIATQPRAQRIGDRVAETIVVRDDAVASPAQVFIAPATDV